MTQRVLRSALRMVPDSVFDAVPAVVSGWLDRLTDEVELRDGEGAAAMLITSSFIAPGSDNEYRADDKDLEDIGECWGEIAEDKGWNMSPGVQLVFLYAIVYGPLLKSALDDRRIMMLEQRQRETEQRQNEHGDRIGQLEKLFKNG